MLFRRSTRLVDAVRLDGSEAALRAVLSIPRAAPSMRAGELEISTACGRRVVRQGDWITRDTATKAVRLYGGDDFQATHEAVR